MSKFKHCFILENGKYIEISFNELLIDNKRNPLFKNRYFIPFSDSLLEVNQEEYKRHYKEKRRNKYLKEEAILHDEISYEVLGVEEIKGQNANNLNELFEDVEKSIDIKNLHRALKTLSNDEYCIIHNLFFKEKTLRQVSLETGVPLTSIYNKKLKILSKLKKVLDF